jgi:ribosomal protein S18 acetylase RimI-like enzyme
MLRFRPFRNTDPPAVTAIWRSRDEQPGLHRPVSVDLLEQFVFGKLYFEYAGLILALDENRPVGFAHAAFGPDESRAGISTDQGVTCLVLTSPDFAQPEIAAGLLERCEAYLCRRGAKVLFGGSLAPLDPFYLGLYGGSELPGVLDSDTLARQLYPSRGYEPVVRTRLLERNLSDYRPSVDRQQREYRRRLIVEVRMDCPTRNWWEACTLGNFDLTRFELVPRGSGTPLATATVRNMQPTPTGAPAQAAGLVELLVDPAHRREGLGAFLLSETLRSLASLGVTTVTAQTTLDNQAAVSLLRKFDFHEVSGGTVFRKEAKPSAAAGP